MTFVMLLSIFGLTHFLMTASVLQPVRDLLAKVPVVGSVLNCWFSLSLVSSVLCYTVGHLLGGVGDVLMLALASSSLVWYGKELANGAVAFLNRKAS